MLVSFLKKQMPTFGKDGKSIQQHCKLMPFDSAKKKELLKSLDQVFAQLSTEFKIPLVDFPDVDETRKKLAT